MANTRVAANFLIISGLALGLGGALMAAAGPHTQTASLVRGKVSGFTLKDKDDRIDGAVVFQTLRASSLMSFQVNDLLGPDEDMKAGPLSESVPSNLQFPAQKEKYVFTITLAKETFGIPYKAGEQSELFAVGFSVPFGETVSKRNNPYRDLLHLVTLRSYGMTDMRDWSAEPNIEIKLDRLPAAGANFAWPRSAPSNTEWDGLVAFQKNANKRWAVADFQESPGATGQTRRVPGLDNDSAYLFLRVKNDKDNQTPRAMVASFVRSADDDIRATDVPAYLNGVSLSGKTLRWAPIFDSGWMAVLRGVSTDALRIKDNNPIAVFGEGLGFGKLLRFGAPLLTWVQPADGILQLDTPLDKKDTLTLLFVKTDTDVAMPTAGDTSDEPELFVHAREMRAQIIQ